MASRRCSTCARNYGLFVFVCPTCGVKTWINNAADPDGPAPKAAVEEEYELGAMDARIYDPEADRKIVSWRLSCFERLGFGVTAASALAMRRDVDRVQVERMLAGGATLPQVVSILL